MYNLDKIYKYRMGSALAISFDIAPISGSGLFSFYVIVLSEEKSEILKLMSEERLK